MPYGSAVAAMLLCCFTVNSAIIPPSQPSYTPGTISTTRIRLLGRDHLVTVTRMASGLLTVKPSSDTEGAVLPVYVRVWYAVPPCLISTVKSSGSPS